jgi:hypothetical protein
MVTGQLSCINRRRLKVYASVNTLWMGNGKRRSASRSPASLRRPDSGMLAGFPLLIRKHSGERIRGNPRQVSMLRVPWI